MRPIDYTPSAPNNGDGSCDWDNWFEDCLELPCTAAGSVTVTNNSGGPVDVYDTDGTTHLGTIPNGEGSVVPITGSAVPCGSGEGTGAPSIAVKNAAGATIAELFIECWDCGPV